MGRLHGQRGNARIANNRTSVGAAAVILTEPSLAREMAGAGEARSTGPVAMKALAEATQVARTARGYAIEYIVRVFWVGTRRFLASGTFVNLFICHKVLFVAPLRAHVNRSHVCSVLSRQTMFHLAAVYTDTVRHTPGRPEFVDAESSTRLWLLPKKQMDEVHYARAHTHTWVTDTGNYVRTPHPRGFLDTIQGSMRVPALAFFQDIVFFPRRPAALLFACAVARCASSPPRSCTGVAH